MTRALPLFLLTAISTSTSAGQAPPRPLLLHRELAIGAPDGPPEYAFGSIDLMALSATGAFYLLDSSDPQIRRYDATGRFQGLVGRSGAGPGEYRQVLGMAVHGDSLLLVFDPGTGRITVFDAAGAYRRSIPFSRGGLYGEKAFAVDRAGLIYVRAALGSERREGLATPSQFVRLRLDGAVVDSLPLPVASSEGWPFVLITTDGPRWSFPTRMIYATLPSGGLLTANTSEYRVTISVVGAAPRVVERPTTPIPLSGAERDEWEAWAGYLAGRPGSTHRSTIPRVKPIIRDLFGDPSGRIWVQVYTQGVKRAVPPRKPGDTRPQLTIREVNVYDVFDAQGGFLGRVELPPQSVLLGVQADRLWVRTERDEGDYLLVRYRAVGLETR